MIFIINMYSDEQQNALKYLKNTKVNLNNVLAMTGDFNIRDNDWNLSYPYHSVYTDILQEVADSFDLELSTPINSVSTQYTNNHQDTNLVLDLIFFQAELEKFNSHKFYQIYQVHQIMLLYQLLSS